MSDFNQQFWDACGVGTPSLSEVKRLFPQVDKNTREYVRILRFQFYLFIYLFQFNSIQFQGVWFVSKYGHEEIMRFLLENGIDPNAIFDGVNPTALFRAKNLEIGRLLLEYGADPLFKNKSGITPYEYLKSKEKPEDLLKLVKECETNPIPQFKDISLQGLFLILQF